VSGKRNGWIATGRRVRPSRVYGLFPVRQQQQQQPLPVRIVLDFPQVGRVGCDVVAVPAKPRLHRAQSPVQPLQAANRPRPGRFDHHAVDERAPRILPGVPRSRTARHAFRPGGGRGCVRLQRATDERDGHIGDGSGLPNAVTRCRAVPELDHQPQRHRRPGA
jgi:hypothetical protein